MAGIKPFPKHRENGWHPHRRLGTAVIVSESCLTDPTITKFLREQNNADEPLFTSRAVKAVL